MISLTSHEAICCLFSDVMSKVSSFPRSDILAFTHFVIKSMLLMIIYQKSSPQSSLIPTVSSEYRDMWSKMSLYFISSLVRVFTKCFSGELKTLRSMFCIAKSPTNTLSPDHTDNLPLILRNTTFFSACSHVSCLCHHVVTPGSFLCSVHG